jgi:hypothetical protein
MDGAGKVETGLHGDGHSGEGTGKPKDFAKACRTYQLPGPPSKVFGYLQKKTGQPFLYYYDIDPDAEIADASAGGVREKNINYKEKVAEENARRKALDVGAKSARGFLQLLVRKYGNIPRAWRLRLDTAGRGQISKMEFFAAARGLAYVGNVGDLWKDLDYDCSGFIGMAELDPEAYFAIEQFRRILREQYGNTLRGWLEGLDVDKNNRLDEEEFAERCEDLCYRGDPKKLFQWFMKDSGTPILSMEDIDPKAAQCFERGDFDMITAETSTVKERREMSFEERHGREVHADVFRSAEAEVREHSTRLASWPRQ